MKTYGCWKYDSTHSHIGVSWRRLVRFASTGQHTPVPTEKKTGWAPNRKCDMYWVEIKCQLDATEVFIAVFIACSTCFGHHYAHHQELKSIIQWLLPVVFRDFYWRSYCLLNIFRAPLCPSSGAQEYLYSGCCLWYLEVFIVYLIACSTCFGHHYAHHQELKSIYTVVAACGILCCGFFK